MSIILFPRLPQVSQAPVDPEAADLIANEINNLQLTSDFSVTLYLTPRSFQQIDHYDGFEKDPDREASEKMLKIPATIQQSSQLSTAIYPSTANMACRGQSSSYFNITDCRPMNISKKITTAEVETSFEYSDFVLAVFKADEMMGFVTCQFFERPRRHIFIDILCASGAPGAGTHLLDAVTDIGSESSVEYIILNALPYLRASTSAACRAMRPKFAAIQPMIAYPEYQEILRPTLMAFYIKNGFRPVSRNEDRWATSEDLCVPLGEGDAVEFFKNNANGIVMVKPLADMKYLCPGNKINL